MKCLLNQELLQHVKRKNETCLWVAQQHTAQLVAGVGLHVRVAETTNLITGSQLETLQKRK